MKRLSLYLPILLAVLVFPVAASARQSDSDFIIGGPGGVMFNNGNGRSIHLDDDGVTFKVKGLPDAVARNDGSVTIGDKALDLSATQRAEVSGYVTQLRVLRDDAGEVGLHAAHFAMSTLWDVTIGLLLNGDTEDKKIDAKADKFAAEVAAKICKPIGVLHDAGLKLAKDVAQLKSYLPPVEDRESCIKDAAKDH